MYESIINFAKQLSFKPVVENGPFDAQRKKIIVGGMGGSHLSAGLLKLADPASDILQHRNYGLPALAPEALSQSACIASSYSGNTEETLDFANAALAAKLPLAAIASGGKLLAFAQEHKLPHVRIPDDIVQPRVAVGVSLKALATLVGQSDIVAELERLAGTFQPTSREKEGKRIAEALEGFTPLIYASATNKAIAFNWKIKINETAKTPAFFNVFSEMNHNELAGFARNERGPKTSFKALFVKDDRDLPRIQKRMEVVAPLLDENGIPTVETALSGDSALERALVSLVTADWTGYYLAKAYGTNPDDNPVVEEFKKRIA